MYYIIINIKLNLIDVINISINRRDKILYYINTIYNLNIHIYKRMI